MTYTKRLQKQIPSDRLVTDITKTTTVIYNLSREEFNLNLIHDLVIGFKCISSNMATGAADAFPLFLKWLKLYVISALFGDLVVGFKSLLANMEMGISDAFPLFLDWLKLYVSLQHKVNARQGQDEDQDDEFRNKFKEKIPVCASYILGALDYQPNIANYHLQIIEKCTSLFSAASLDVVKTIIGFDIQIIGRIWLPIHFVGDYNTQKASLRLIAAVLKHFSEPERYDMLKAEVPESQYVHNAILRLTSNEANFETMLSQIRTSQDEVALLQSIMTDEAGFERISRELLNEFNMKITKHCTVFSVYCTTALFGSFELFKSQKADKFWIDFNYTSKSVSFLCGVNTSANQREELNVQIKISQLQLCSKNHNDCIVVSSEPAEFSAEVCPGLKNARVAVFTLPQSEVQRLEANRDLLDFYKQTYCVSNSDDIVATPNTIENYLAENPWSVNCSSVEIQEMRDVCKESELFEDVSTRSPVVVLPRLSAQDIMKITQTRPSIDVQNTVTKKTMTIVSPANPKAERLHKSRRNSVLYTERTTRIKSTFHSFEGQKNTQQSGATVSEVSVVEKVMPLSSKNRQDTLVSERTFETSQKGLPNSAISKESGYNTAQSTVNHDSVLFKKPANPVRKKPRLEATNKPLQTNQNKKSKPEPVLQNDRSKNKSQNASAVELPLSVEKPKESSRTSTVEIPAPQEIQSEKPRKSSSGKSKRSQSCIKILEQANIPRAKERNVQKQKTKDLPKAKLPLEQIPNSLENPKPSTPNPPDNTPQINKPSNYVGDIDPPVSPEPITPTDRKENTATLQPKKPALKRTKRPRRRKLTDTGISPKRKQVNTVKPLNHLTKPDGDPEQANQEYVENGGYDNIVDYMRSNAAINRFNEDQRKQVLENIKKINEGIEWTTQHFRAKGSQCINTDSSSSVGCTKKNSRKKKKSAAKAAKTTFVPYSKWKTKQKSKVDGQSTMLSVESKQNKKQSANRARATLNPFDQLKLTVLEGGANTGKNPTKASKESTQLSTVKGKAAATSYNGTTNKKADRPGEKIVLARTTAAEDVWSDCSESSCSNHNFHIAESDNESCFGEETLPMDMICRKEPDQLEQSQASLPLEVSQWKIHSRAMQNACADISAIEPTQCQVNPGMCCPSPTADSEASYQMSEIFEGMDPTPPKGFFNLEDSQQTDLSGTTELPTVRYSQPVVPTISPTTIAPSPPVENRMLFGIGRHLEKQHPTVAVRVPPTPIMGQLLPYSSTDEEISPSDSSVRLHLTPEKSKPLPQNITTNHVYIQNQIIVSTSRKRHSPVDGEEFALVKRPFSTNVVSSQGYADLLPTYIERMTKEKERLLQEASTSLREESFLDLNEIHEQLIKLTDETETAIKETRNELFSVFGKLPGLIEKQQQNQSKLDKMHCELLGKMKASVPDRNDAEEAYNDIEEALKSYSDKIAGEQWRNCGTGFLSSIVGKLTPLLKW